MMLLRADPPMRRLLVDVVNEGVRYRADLDQDLAVRIHNVRVEAERRSRR